MTRRYTRLVVIAALLAPASALAQNGAQEIDACGVLVQGVECVLFETAGGAYLLSDYADFKAGDFVRVVGTADPSCVTICGDADGCVRGARVYDPLQFPCGTALPDFPGDICTGLAGTLLAGSAAGLVGLRSRRKSA
jgi:hypothetical protein